MSSTTEKPITLQANPSVETVSGSVSLDNAAASFVTVLAPSSGFKLIDWHELVAYRDLFRFLIWREIKVRYAQSAIGIGWAVIQPLCSMAVSYTHLTLPTIYSV